MPAATRIGLSRPCSGNTSLADIFGAIVEPMRSGDWCALNNDVVLVPGPELVG